MDSQSTHRSERAQSSTVLRRLSDDYQPPSGVAAAVKFFVGFEPSSARAAAA